MNVAATTAAAVAAHAAARQKAILSSLRDGGARGSEGAISIPDRTKHDDGHLKYLVKKDLVRHAGQERYYITNKGIEALQPQPGAGMKVLLFLIILMSIAASFIALVMSR